MNSLINADATALPFVLDENFHGFDGRLTGQATQHIPACEKAVVEVSRVLKGVFATYSLNIQAHIKVIKRLVGKVYLTKGWVERWPEIIYSPDLHFPTPGRENSWLEKLDVKFSNNVGFELEGWKSRVAIVKIDLDLSFARMVEG